MCVFDKSNHILLKRNSPTKLVRLTRTHTETERTIEYRKKNREKKCLIKKIDSKHKQIWRKKNFRVSGCKTKEKKFFDEKKNAFIHFAKYTAGTFVLKNLLTKHFNKTPKLFRTYDTFCLANQWIRRWYVFLHICCEWFCIFSTERNFFFIFNHKRHVRKCFGFFCVSNKKRECTIHWHKTKFDRPIDFVEKSSKFIEPTEWAHTHHMPNCEHVHWAPVYCMTTRLTTKV